MPKSKLQLDARTFGNPEVTCRTGRIRVLFIVKRIVGGGAERVITTLARRVNRFRFEPHLATLSVDAYREDIPNDVSIHRLNATEMRWAIPRLVSLVRRVRPHVVLSTLVEANVAVLLARSFFPSGTKVIVREGSSVSDMLQYLLPFPFAWKQAYRHLYPHADAIVCMSRSLQVDLLKHIPVEIDRAPLIYNGVEVASIEERAEGASPYTGCGPNLLAVGRLSPEKNFSLLLDAFASIRASLPMARLTILGTGPQELPLKRRALELGVSDAVEFRGFQDNPFPYYRNADLYLQTSLFEGLGNALLEVLSLGTPAVATVAGGPAGEIAELAGSVRLVREAGAEAYAGAVIETLRGPRPKFRRESFLEAFSVERMMRQYETLFATVASQAPIRLATPLDPQIAANS